MMIHNTLVEWKRPLFSSNLVPNPHPLCEVTIYNTYHHFDTVLDHPFVKYIRIQLSVSSFHLSSSYHYAYHYQLGIAHRMCEPHTVANRFQEQRRKQSFPHRKEKRESAIFGVATSNHKRHFGVQPPRFHL